GRHVRDKAAAGTADGQGAVEQPVPEALQAGAQAARGGLGTWGPIFPPGRPVRAATAVLTGAPGFPALDPILPTRHARQGWEHQPVVFLVLIVRVLLVFVARLLVLVVCLGGRGGQQPEAQRQRCEESDHPCRLPSKGRGCEGAPVPPRGPR